MATETVRTKTHQPVEEKMDEEIPKVEEKESLSSGEKGVEAQQFETRAVEVSEESTSDSGKDTQQSEKKTNIGEQLKEVEETLEVKSKEITEKLESISTEGRKTNSVVPGVAVKLEGQSEQIEILSKEADKLDFIAPEVKAKLESQSEQVTEKIDKLDMAAAEVAANLGGQSEVTETVETISKGGEKPVSVVPEVDIKQETPTEVEPRVKDEETLADKIEKLDMVAAEVEAKLGQSEVTKKAETVSKESEKLVSVVPEVDTKQETPTEVEPKVKDEETLADKVDKLDTVAAEVEAKLGGQSEVTEKVETVSEEGEKPVAVVPEVDTKQQTPTEVELKVKDKEILADEVEEKISKEEETSVCLSSEQVISTNREPETAEKKDVVEPSLPDVTERKESSGVGVVESWSKEAVVGEFTQPVKEESVKGADAQVTESASPEENIRKDKDAAVVKNGSEENAKDEKPAIVETKKDAKTEEKLDDVKEPPKTDLEVKEREVSKDGDDTKTSQDLPKEAPAKPTQKQSNNLISKVKHSLVKAKKAITGKSPTSKTKDDSKAK